MKIQANNPEEYLEQLEEDRREALTKLRQTILENLPEGFSEEFSAGFISYVVPHSLYPDGYHCNPTQPLPFISMTSRKGFVALYHMGIYANEELFKWFQEQYPNHSQRKLDMGKSCIRFKNVKHIPYDLIAELVSKMTTKDWIGLYEKNIKKS